MFLILMWDFTWIWKALSCSNFSLQSEFNFLAKYSYTLICIIMIWCSSMSPDFISYCYIRIWNIYILLWCLQSAHFLFLVSELNIRTPSPPPPKKGQNKCIDMYFIVISGTKEPVHFYASYFFMLVPYTWNPQYDYLVKH